MHRPSPARKPLIAALAGERQPRPPIWLMRQAGRYLPEYRELRARAATFLDFCYTPALAVEATLQPIRRFGFDAAILFSDILVVADALGQSVSFESAHGPRLDPIGDAGGVSRLSDEPDWNRLAPVFEALDRLKSTLPREVALIGFCGAPWTVASYMIAGRGTPDQAPARLFAYRHSGLFKSLIDRLVDASAGYLLRQLEAGAEAVQIFDSWAGVLPPAEFERWCVAPIAALVAKVRAGAPDAPIIVFPRGAATQLAKFAGMPGVAGSASTPPSNPPSPPGRCPIGWRCRAISIRWRWSRAATASTRASIACLAGFQTRAHIFNLGHGVLPETPVEHVERLVARVRGHASAP